MNYSDAYQLLDDMVESVSFFTADKAAEGRESVLSKFGFCVVVLKNGLAFSSSEFIMDGDPLSDYGKQRLKDKAMSQVFRCVNFLLASKDAGCVN